MSEENGYSVGVYDMQKGGGGPTDEVKQVKTVEELKNYLTGIRIDQFQEARLNVRYNSQWHNSFIFAPMEFYNGGSNEFLGVSVQGEDYEKNAAFVPLLDLVLNEALSKFKYSVAEEEFAKMDIELIDNLETREYIMEALFWGMGCAGNASTLPSLMKETGLDVLGDFSELAMFDFESLEQEEGFLMHDVIKEAIQSILEKIKT